MRHRAHYTCRTLFHGYCVTAAAEAEKRSTHSVGKKGVATVARPSLSGTLLHLLIGGGGLRRSLFQFVGTIGRINLATPAG